jgi:hypothetical protein
LEGLNGQHALMFSVSGTTSPRCGGIQAVDKRLRTKLYESPADCGRLKCGDIDPAGAPGQLRYGQNLQQGAPYRLVRLSWSLELYQQPTPATPARAGKPRWWCPGCWWTVHGYGRRRGAGGQADVQTAPDDRLKARIEKAREKRK